MTKYEKLLSPGTIGNMKLRNRIVLPGMVKNYATPDGFVTRQMIDHYAARARGGVGLEIIEATYVKPSGKGFLQQLGIHDDICIPGLNNLTEAVKECGGKIAIQLFHAGGATNVAVSGMTVVAPSVIPDMATEASIAVPTLGPDTCRELTTAECDELVEDFAQAARRARDAGFDAIELHGAHSYIIAQFISPFFNRRTDKYGGDINGRMTFILEIIKRIKDLIGDDYPIIVRMNGEDLLKGGVTLDESRLVAQKLQAAGVNALNVSGGAALSQHNPDVIGHEATMFSPRGHLVHLAENIKRVVTIPVIAVSSITPEMGEEIIGQGKADFIAMGRALLAEPELPNKLASGNQEDIRPCIRCNERCSGRLALSIRCVVNAECGLESYEMTPGLRRKNVLIIGGGPAGMEAARVATLRGHDVTLYEKNSQLGGHLIEATVPGFKEDVKSYKDWLIRQITKLGVNIKLGEEVTAQIAGSIKPDAIIVATGSTSYRPDITGADKPNVTTAIDILLGKAAPGNKTIVAGGGGIGCEVALYLAQQGKKVTVVEMLPDVATDVSMVRKALINELNDNGVEILTNLKIIEINDNGVITHSQNQEKVEVAGDKVVLALGMVAQAGLYESLKDKASEIYLIGDAANPARIGEATREGYRIGNIL